MVKKKDEKIDLVLGKLEEHGRILAEHSQKFEEHDNKFDRVLTSQDKILKELEIAREDRIFAKAKDDEIEKRVEKLEMKVG